MRTQLNGEVFASKKDSWLVLLVAVSCALCFGGSYDVWTSTESVVGRVLVVGLLLSISVLMIWVLMGTNYRVAEDRLFIQCGPFKSQIFYQEIQEITPSRNPASSPACSLDRLKVRLSGAKADVLVSPNRRIEFLISVASKDAELEIRGDSVHRTKRDD